MVERLPPVMRKRLDVARVDPLEGISGVQRHPLGDRKTAVRHVMHEAMVKAIRPTDRRYEAEVGEASERGRDLGGLTLP